MLTFDVDGVSSWLRRDPNYGSLPSLMSMAEYGPSVAAPRILDLLDKHDIKASFYVPGYVAESHQDLVREIAARGHELGHHGYLHEAPASMSPEAFRNSTPSLRPPSAASSGGITAGITFRRCWCRTKRSRYSKRASKY